MAINFNNRNQGIGALNLGDLGLMQPEENMTVAEVFNTPQSLMEIGAVEPGMFSGYNLTDQGEVLEDFRNSAVKMRNATGSPTYNQGIQSQFNRMLSIPSSFKDVIKNQEYIQDAINKGFLKEKSDFKNQKSFADPDNLQAMAISNYDQLFGPTTMSDANRSLYTGIMNQSGTPIDYIDRIRQQNLPEFASQPQYRIRDQLSRDFLQGGLFRDAKQSLGQTKDAFLEDISGLTRGLGSLKDRGLDFLGLAKDKGIDLGKMIGRGIGNAIFPGLGFVLGAVKESPTDKVGLASFGGDYDPYGYKSDLSAGNLGERQDPFGRNIASLAGNYEQNRINELKELTQLENLGLLNNKFKKDKLNFARNYLEKVRQERERNQRNRARENFANVYAEADKRGFTGPGGGFSTEQKGKEGAFGTFGEGRGRKDY